MAYLESNSKETINLQPVPSNPLQVIQSPNNPDKRWIIYLSLAILLVVVILALVWYFYSKSSYNPANITTTNVKETVDTLNLHPDIRLLNETLGVGNLEMKIFDASGSGNPKATAKLLVLSNYEIDNVILNSLPEDTGKVFFHDTPFRYTYWMKNELVPLDFIWVLEERIIGFTLNVAPPINNSDDESIPTFTPPLDIDTAVEMNAGYVESNNLEIGDLVEFSNL